MCGCKDRDESKTTPRFLAEESWVIVHPPRLRVKKKKHRDKDAVFEKVGDVHGLVVIWVTNCHAALTFKNRAAEKDWCEHF